MRRLTVKVFVGLAVSLTMCKRKEGPPGPPGPPGPAGRDLTRPQEGFIEGTARGKDNSGNPFNISFRYTYYYGPSGIALLSGANELQISFAREDEKGIGNIGISFTYSRSNGQINDLQLSGVAADISTSPVRIYNVQQIPSINLANYPGTSQNLSNIQISGDTLITGNFTYIRPAYTPPNINIPGIDLSSLANPHPDTVSGRFSIRLTPIVSYGRQGQ
ncbi:MAG: hypothetical protein NZZ60_04670 [Bacteroidia bacterium]|nr:hypothetical protein [Bacteroidia bacterium]MCX7651556.1 hypothetical protein [Bacteroidia bacterium]MDW8416247.1 hypothetical protein [Bacteroidia bacterium]